MTDPLTAWASLVTELDAHRPRARSSVSSDTGTVSVPVTLLTGFLGAGKTTLLGALLVSPPDGLVVRAIVNDIGSLPFDPTLIDAWETGALDVELTNGCGCCQATADLAAGLLRAAVGADLVVLEASGAADPLAIAQIVEAADNLHLDRVVAVVDALACDELLGQPTIAPLVTRQLDAAEVVVLTGADRIDEPKLRLALERLAQVAPGRVLVPSGIDAPVTDVLVPGSVRGARPPIVPSPVEHRFPTITIEPDRRFEAAEIEQLVATRPVSIMRIKGRLPLADGSAAVQVTPSSHEVSSTTAPAPETSQLTVVGTDRAELEHFIHRFL